MKKLNLLLLAFLAVMGVTFQSCDDDDGYSLGDVAAALFCLLLNLISALIPAWNALRHPIVESLNEQK